MFKTLIVEDNPTFRQTLCEILCARFPAMCVAQAREGKEALRIVEELLPDLIFMDIKMPGESGLELTKRIKGNHPDAVVVVLTSYDFPEYRGAARQCGASYFLCKGATSGEEILQLVESIMSERSVVGPNRN